MLPSLSWINAWWIYSWRLLLETICWFCYPNTDGADSTLCQQHYFVLYFPSPLVSVLLSLNWLFCSQKRFQHHLPLYDCHFPKHLLCIFAKWPFKIQFHVYLIHQHTHLSLFTPNPHSLCVNDNILLSSDNDDGRGDDIMDRNNKLNLFYLLVFTICC